MGSSGGTSNPAYLSQGATPIPNLPIAGQDNFPGAKPQEFGSYQSFLPDIPSAGQGPAPLARGLTAEMLQFKSPQGVAAPSSAAATAAGSSSSSGGSSSDVEAMKQQIAALQAQAGNGQFGAAEQPGFGQFGQKSGIGFPQNWTNSNVPFATS